MAYVPVTEKACLFEELHIETVIRNPKQVGLFGYRVGFGISDLGLRDSCGVSRV